MFCKDSLGKRILCCVIISSYTIFAQEPITEIVPFGQNFVTDKSFIFKVQSSVPDNDKEIIILTPSTSSNDLASKFPKITILNKNGLVVTQATIKLGTGLLKQIVNHSAIAFKNGSTYTFYFSQIQNWSAYFKRLQKNARWR